MMREGEPECGSRAPGQAPPWHLLADEAWVAMRVVEVRPVADARILFVDVTGGSVVAEGDELVRLENAPLDAALDAAMQEVADACRRLLAAPDDAARDASLRAEQAARARYRAAWSSRRALAQLLAPCGGEVVAVCKGRGSIARGGEPLVRIADPTHLRIHARLPPWARPHCAPGAEADVLLDGGTGTSLRGRVERLERAGLGAVAVIALTEEGRPPLHHGERVVVSLHLGA